MAEDKLTVASAIYDAFTHKDVDAALALCDPDVEFDWSRRLLDPIVLRGHAEVRRFIAEALEIFEKIDFGPKEKVLERGDDLLIATTARFRGRASGIDVAARAANLWTIRDGRVLRFRFYQSSEDALADLGQPGR